MEPTGTWTQLSHAIVAIVKATAGSVVRVEAGTRGTSSGVVWSADVIVTVADGLDDDTVMVGFPSGETDEADVVGRDPSTDLAVLRRRSGALDAPAWSDQPLDVGQLVFSITRPGRSARAGLGLVSRLGEAWRTRGGGKLDRYVELDVTLHPGLSGGLVVDAEGRGIGIASARLIRGTPLVVPISTVRRVASELLTHGAVRRGYLGLSSLPVDLPTTLAAGGSQRAGLLLTAVEDGSPAARAGLLIGDLLLTLDGTPLGNIGDLLGCLDADRIGQVLHARIIRGGVTHDLEVELGSRAT